jgi:hypothetical protein
VESDSLCKRLQARRFLLPYFLSATLWDQAVGRRG